MATKKEEVLTGEADEGQIGVEPTTPRIQHDFLREDLNELRDAVNELYARG